MATILTPAQEALRREAIRTLAVLLAMELMGQNRDDDEPMPCSLAEPAEPMTAANAPSPAAIRASPARNRPPP